MLCFQMDQVACSGFRRDPLNDIALLKLKARDCRIWEFADSRCCSSGGARFSYRNALGEYANTSTMALFQPRATNFSFCPGFGRRLW